MIHGEAKLMASRSKTVIKKSDSIVIKRLQTLLEIIRRANLVSWLDFDTAPPKTDTCRAQIHPY